MEELLDPNIVNEEDIIIKAENIMAEAPDSVSGRSQAIDNIIELITELPDQGTRELFIDEIAEKFKVKKKILQAKLSHAIKNTPPMEQLPFELDIPDGVDKDDALKKGYFESRSAYYFLTKEGVFKASNFVMKPVLHIYSKTDNKRIIEVTNEYGEHKLLDLPSKNMVSTDLFQQSVFNEGNFIFFGNKSHYYRILSCISRNFPIANELRTLGWQREGFYAFANGIFNGNWQRVDEIGVCSHEDKRYFSPSFSKIYSDVREDDDDYENDRYFVYQQSPVSFTAWCKLMISVYGEKAHIAIAYLVSCLFRDIIYDHYKIYPHLFLFGEKQSGKSQLAWSLSNLFFDQMPAFNLNSGTQVGFFRRLSRVRNAVCWFDEYTNDIDERRFQSLKSAYDGMGHEKGKMTKDSRTEVTKVNSPCVISGQYLPTRDDNSLLTRSILLTFEKSTYSDEQIKSFNQLKELETKGLSSIVTELLAFRPVVEKEFIQSFAREFDKLKHTLKDSKQAFDERLVRNYTAGILSVTKIIMEQCKIDTGFCYDTLFEQSVEGIAEQTAQITNSEAVSTFWLTVQYMFESIPAQIHEGADFKIQTYTKALKVKNKKDRWENIDFYANPKKLIFFRFSKIHPLYMEAHRKQYGKNGVDLVSLIHYVKHHKAFIGISQSTRFDTVNTSAYVFDYNMLSLALDTNQAEEVSADDSTRDDQSQQPEDELPF